ncbi:hypothetical protein Hanom_Chr09g00819441 [Helianthus anomalus]
MPKKNKIFNKLSFGIKGRITSIHRCFWLHFTEKRTVKRKKCTNLNSIPSQKLWRCSVQPTEKLHFYVRVSSRITTGSSLLSVLAAVTSMSSPSSCATVASRSSFCDSSSTFTFFCILSYILLTVFILCNSLSHFSQNQFPSGIQVS